MTPGVVNEPGARASTGKLDFIVLGTGRSGTSAVARYLSAVRGVHCGLELFSPWTDHRTLCPPACFEDLTAEELPRGMRRPAPRLLQVSLDEIARRGADLRFFGNKTPNYLFRLRGLLEEIAPGKAIVCWRDMRSIAESYARRADDPKDSWEPGKRAIFAVADFITCLQALAALDGYDVMIVPNRAVVADWDKATRQMIDYLLPDLGEVSYDPVNLAAINRRLVRAKATPHSHPVWTPTELRAVEAVEKTGVDTLMNRDSIYRLSDVAEDLRAIVAALPTDIVAHTRALTDENGVAAGIDYLPRWSNMHAIGRRPQTGAARPGRLDGAQPRVPRRRAGP